MRRSNNRCPRCLVHEDNCICQKITPISIQNKLSIILFKKEKWLPSNTANLALMSVNPSLKFERGHKDTPLPHSFVDSQESQPLYLFPSEDATELTRDFVDCIAKPINLIVPDGTWRQAKKVHKRETVLENIPHVKITPRTPSRYTLRRQKYEFGLCTFEAIAEALRIMEGEECFKVMQENFSAFLDAHHKNRSIFEPIKKKGIHTSPKKRELNKAPDQK